MAKQGRFRPVLSWLRIVCFVWASLAQRPVGFSLRVREVQDAIPGQTRNHNFLWFFGKTVDACLCQLSYVTRLDVILASFLRWQSGSWIVVVRKKNYILRKSSEEIHCSVGLFCIYNSWGPLVQYVLHGATKLQPYASYTTYASRLVMTPSQKVEIICLCVVFSRELLVEFSLRWCHSNNSIFWVSEEFGINTYKGAPTFQNGLQEP